MSAFTTLTVQPMDPRPPLSRRRAALLARIHVGRRETTETGRLFAADLLTAERTTRSIFAGLRILGVCAVATCAIWGANSMRSRSASTANPRLGPGSRLLTVAVSLFSTLRTLRKLALFLTPLAAPTGTQEPHHDYRSR